MFRDKVMKKLLMLLAVMMVGGVASAMMYDVTFYEPKTIVVENKKDKSLTIFADRAFLSDMYSCMKMPYWCHAIACYKWELIKTIKIERNGKKYIYTVKED